MLVSLDGISHKVLEKKHGKCQYTERLRTANPSVTLPVHMSVLTGMWTERHGIFENVTFFQYPYKRTKLYYLDDKTATAIVGKQHLIHCLENQGIACKLIHWPLGNGFSCDAVCERAIAHDALEGVEEAKKSDQKAFQELLKTFKNWKKEKNGFIAVHFVEYDAVAHMYGINHPKTEKALERVLGYIEKIKTIQKKYYIDKIMFFSDHGLINRTDTFYPHLYIGEKRELKDGFRFLCDGSGSAMYYSILSEIEDAEILDELKTSSKVDHIKLIENKGSYTCSPKAIISMQPGVCAEDILPDESPHYEEMKGIHGYDSIYVEEMDGFLFIEEENKKKVGCCRNSVVDLAPTIAEWYGCTYECDGKIEKTRGDIT